MEESVREEHLMKAEAYSYFSFVDLLSHLKENFIKNFQKIKFNFQKVETLVEKKDKSLFDYLKRNELNLFHFAFRWNFCLLLREFPTYLSI